MSATWDDFGDVVNRLKNHEKYMRELNYKLTGYYNFGLSNKDDSPPEPKPPSELEQLLTTLRNTTNNFPLKDKLEHYYSKGFKVGTLEDYARLNIQNGAQAYTDIPGFFVKEVLLNTDKETYLLKRSPLLDFPEFAHNAHDIGNAFVITKEQSEQYLNSDIPKLELDKSKNNPEWFKPEVLYTDFERNNLTKFLFGDYAHELGEEILSKKYSNTKVINRNNSDYYKERVCVHHTLPDYKFESDNRHYSDIIREIHRWNKKCMSFNFNIGSSLSKRYVARPLYMGNIDGDLYISSGKCFDKNPTFLWVKEDERYPNTLFSLIE